ncbi:MAG: hypothetical protein ACM31C_05780 [Acidobacteriota bacterium]
MRTALVVAILGAAGSAHADAGVGSGVVLSLGFDGASGTQAGPPDVGGGALSDGQVIDVVSGLVAVRDETGHLLTSWTSDAFWNAAGVAGTPNAVAQHAVFNALNQRWYVSAEQATTGTPNQIYLAVSASYDATGPWKAVTLPPQASPIRDTHLAVDACGVYLTGDTSAGGVVLALPLADLQWTAPDAPTAAHLNVLPTARGGVVPAIDAWNQIASDARMFVGRDVTASGTTAIDVYRLSWTGSLCTATGPAQIGSPSTVDLGVAYALPGRAAVQPSPAPGLQAGSGALANADSRSGTIVGIATTEIGGQLGAVWFQIYADPSTPGIGPDLLQSGTLVDPSADLLVPAIATATNGFGIVYVRTSSQDPPSIYVTAQATGDPPGTLREPVLARAGAATYSCAATAGVSAFGRYSSIVGTATGFWAVAQLGASATECAFATAWVNFDVIPNPSGGDPGPVADDSWNADHPPQHAGCGGCSSSGDPGGVLVLLAIVACTRRRT